VIITAIFIVILLVVLIIIIIIEMKDSKTSKIDDSENYPVIIESNPRSSVLKKSRDGPQNTASRMNRYRSRYIDDDSKSIVRDSSFSDSMTTSISKPPSTIQKEYQRLLHPSPQFYIDEKVFVNDNDLAQIIETDGK